MAARVICPGGVGFATRSAPGGGAQGWRQNEVVDVLYCQRALFG